jgi:hypothetical protein
MKRIGLALVIAIIGVVLLWFAGMSIANTSLTRLEIRVSGSVDEVSLFRLGDQAHPIAVIETNGIDTTEIVNLRSSQYFSLFHQAPPAAYAFAIRKGDSVYSGKKICCENSFFTHRSVLTISGPSAWQITDD